MKLRNILVSAMAATALTAMPAQAEESTDSVSASQLIDTDLKANDIEFAQVEDFVLSADGSMVEFVLFQAQDGVATEATRIGFVPWTNIQLDADSVEHDLVVTGEAEDGPQELTMTRAEANTRVLSRILDADLAFADGVVRPIDDVLFDPETGEVDNVVVEFAENDMMIPAEFIRLSPSDGYSVVQPSDYGYSIYIVG